MLNTRFNEDRQVAHGEALFSRDPLVHRESNLVGHDWQLQKKKKETTVSHRVNIALFLEMFVFGDLCVHVNVCVPWVCDVQFAFSWVSA